jgi:hypothetical protein
MGLNPSSQKFRMEKFGFPANRWKIANEEAKRVLIAHAKLRGMMPCSELIGQNHPISDSSTCWGK